MDIKLLVVIMVMGTPLLIILWFLVRIANAYITKISHLKNNGKDTKKEYCMFLLLSCLIVIVSLMVIFFLLIVFMPGIMSVIPTIVYVMIMIFISVIYGCLIALFIGLKDVVRAGGSAGEIIKTLSTYINEAININDTKDYNKNKKFYRKR